MFILQSPVNMLLLHFIKVFTILSIHGVSQDILAHKQPVYKRKLIVINHLQKKFTLKLQFITNLFQSQVNLV